jgi:phosphonate metabolism protein PhnN/1,5-bisphosphokinase (PRPP-forming)
MSGRGALFLVVGPSGAGKDSIIAGAARRFAGDPRIVFARRVITRAAEAGGEQHSAVSPGEFAALRDSGRLMLHWRAHGLDYGVPQELAEVLGGGRCVVANVSRSVVDEARRRFPPWVVVAISASPEVLAGRLASRGREDAAGVAERLRRSDAVSPVQADVVIENNGQLGDAVDRFVELLTARLDQVAST